MHEKVTVYSPSSRDKNNIFQILKSAFLDIKKYKWQIVLSIKKQIKSTYQQDTFGLFWAIIMPIIPMTVYMLLAHIKVFNAVENMPFVFYIAIGMFTWLLMSTIIRKVLLSIKQEKAILRTTDFPILISMMSQLGEVLNESFIRIFAVVAIVIWYQIDLSFVSFVLVVLSFIPIILISFSIGVLVAILDMLLQDTRRIVDIFLRYGLFISSVIIPFPTEGLIGRINEFNIFNTYVVSVRDLLFYGQMSNLDTFIYTSLVGFIIFLASMKILYKMDYKIRDYL
jgi:ABC-type polysaccharide/polyol phosphate export permease